jgi:ubiquinone/menaquinone biosynthesis C-methylase UbiE
MSNKIQSNRWRQILAWAVACLFFLGFFFPPLGAWTGAILGVWFVGTQRPRRGFLWQMVLTFLPSLVANWRSFPLAGLEPALEYVAWMLLAALLTVLPFLFHRLTSPRLPGFLATLPLPLWGAVLQTVALAWLPANIAATFGHGAGVVLIYWFAAVVIRLWNHEFRASKTAMASLPAAVCVIAVGFGHPWICLGGALALSAWALLRPGKQRRWADRPEIVAKLQSPYTGSPLHVVREDDREALVSPSGERFPIRHGIPAFLKPEELTGPNRKYNHLYETIGGFYDDIQRVVSALTGMDRDAYVMSYLGLLEIKPGDSVLETSVGTGLNFKYLPRDIKRSGVDLSAEMLVNCQANLRRWEMDADLFLGNAESLPFTDASFDVVFHTGGINFFSDRAKAIREMIRVAKPGSLMLIADETEEHVKRAYEQGPITSRYFKHRKEAVTAPIDLVPADMREIRLESIWNGRFYALTFRKPTAGDQLSLSSGSEASMSTSPLSTRLA